MSPLVRCPALRPLPLLAALLSGPVALPAAAQAVVAPQNVEAPPDEVAATPVQWRLRVDAPGALKGLLEEHLDLARYADLARANQGVTVSRSELARLVASTPAQATGLLQTEGYFNPQVTATLSAATDRPEVLVSVKPGPRTVVKEVQIDFSGAFSLAQDRQDADALALAERLRRDFALKAGEPFVQSTWSSAKTALLTSLRAEGYGFATLSGTSAQIAADDNAAQLFLFVDSGPRLYVHGTRFEGLRHVGEPAVAALSTFHDGEPVRDQVLQDTQDRLVKSNLFDTVAVTVAPEVFESADGSLAPVDTSAERLDVPITVKLRERAMQQATVGVGVSDITGPRVTLEHIHQHPFGLDWQSKIKLELAAQSRQAALDLLSYPEADGHRKLVSGAIARTEATGLVIQSQNLRVGRTEDTPHMERLAYVQWTRDRTRNGATGMPVEDTSALTLNYHWVWRDLDSIVLPTRGYSILAEAGGGRSYHAEADAGMFGRLRTRLTGYWPLPASFFGQARVEAGQILAPNRVAVPFTQAFRAGGDDSVRGYNYQGLGPTDASGNAIGGRVLATASLELARPITQKLPAFWWATFVDAGNAADNWQRLAPALGYGVGLRWRSPVGPLRIDLAYGEKARRVRLHFSVGVTF
jgi:translocation and assembly module TamA